MKRETVSVLVLEPNALLCDLIKMALVRSGMNPIVCGNPATLRQALVEHVPDVLLNRTKVFFLSSLGFPEIVQKAAQIGASGFLVKPLDPDLLISRISNSFNKPVKYMFG